MDFSTIGGRVVVTQEIYEALSAIANHCRRDTPQINEFCRIELLNISLHQYRIERNEGVLATDNIFNTLVPCGALFDYSQLSSCGHRVGWDPKLCPKCEEIVEVASCIRVLDKQGLLNLESIHLFNLDLERIVNFCNQFQTSSGHLLNLFRRGELIEHNIESLEPILTHHIEPGYVSD